MRIGAVFSQADAGTDPDAIRRWVVDVESAGFEHVLAYDHVPGASPERLGPGPFGAFPTAPYTSEHTFHEILVLYSHFAALTSTLQFVTSVLVLPQRQTALAAKQISTIDLLSGGRLRVAVGVGWNAAEYEGLGVDFADRTASQVVPRPSISNRSSRPSRRSIASPACSRRQSSRRRTSSHVNVPSLPRWSSWAPTRPSGSSRYVSPSWTIA
jgi:hypothetical protein